MVAGLRPDLARRALPRRLPEAVESKVNAPEKG